MNEFLHPGKFAPLTENELAAVSAAGSEAQDAGELVSPVPPGAPPMPPAHSKFGKPSARWRYLDASGALIFEVWRLDPDGERKQFLPVSVWRDADGLRWRWKGVPAPRPLYGLDKLAADPGASVVICEGEKAADAAALIFSKSICITSPGGAQSASKADWSPLRGRRVLVWPDADGPGAKYATEVAAILHGLGCGVSIIDAVALAGLAPDGGTREQVKGWDAADAAADGETLVRFARWPMALPNLLRLGRNISLGVRSRWMRAASQPK